MSFILNWRELSNIKIWHSNWCAICNIIIIIIIIIIICFMQGIYTYIPETNYVHSEYSVAAILLLLFMVLVSFVVIIIRYVCLLSQAFLPGTSLEPVVIPTAQASSFTLQLLSILCVMFQVQLSFVVNLSNVFPVQLPNFSLSFSLLFQWLQLLLVQSYISGSTFAVSLYINSCILTSFPLPFAQHFCLQVLPHLSVCIFSLYCLLLLLLLNQQVIRKLMIVKSLRDLVQE